MKTVKRLLQLTTDSDLSIRQIAKALGIPPSTVSDYQKRIKSSGLILSDFDNKTEQSIYQQLFKEISGTQYSKPIPDFSKVHQELKKKHVTRHLLWEEYQQQHPDGYGYTQYCEHYNRWLGTVNISMRQTHKAGEKMFVDYSGLRVEVIDRHTGEIRKVQIFVAALGASGYTFAKAYESQKKHDFISGHVDAFNFFGGAVKILVPDNLKAAVTKFDRYEPVLNATYMDMAEHYQSVIIPARPAKPKDKSKVELSVKLVQRWILAKLRHNQFFSISQLNDAIAVLLEALNNKKIQRLGKSRTELFIKIDKPALNQLPEEPYCYREYKECTVNIDYHVDVDRRFYSVPYKLVGQKVSVYYSASAVDIYHNNKRVAIHRRISRLWGKSTLSEHMASTHRVYAEWTPSRLISWGKSFGEDTAILIEKIMRSKRHPEQGFRTCMGILNSCKDMDQSVVEATSRKMLSLNVFTASYFHSIIKHKTYKSKQLEIAATPDVNHENVRGERYYVQEGEQNA